MGLSVIKNHHNQRSTDFLQINKNKGSVKAGVRVWTYKDKDTGHFVAYVPSLELSGYGSDLKEAEQMLSASIEELFIHLLSLPDIGIRIELKSLGWLKDKIKSKIYSKAYVDMKGELKNFALTETINELVYSL